MKFLTDILFALLLLGLTSFADIGGEEMPNLPSYSIDVSSLQIEKLVTPETNTTVLGDSQVSIRNETGVALEVLFSGKNESLLSKNGMQIYFFDSTKATQIRLFVGAPRKHGSSYNLTLKPNGIYSLVVKNSPKGIELFEEKPAAKLLKTKATAKR